RRGLAREPHSPPHHDRRGRADQRRRGRAQPWARAVRAAGARHRGGGLMWRALAEGAIQAAFGHTPGGGALYRRLTREIGGTQATHVDKLARVLPGYCRVWTERAGLRLEGARFWMHEGGWTPYPFLAAYLLTGSGGTVTNGAGRMLGRYLVAAV